MAEPEILIVDDDVDTLKTAATLISLLGYSLETADNPHVALSVIRRSESLKVLLTDVLMPEMDGFALADEAKRLRPELRVIYVTAYARDMLPAGHRLHGNFIVKPWTLDQVEAEIKHCLA